MKKSLLTCLAIAALLLLLLLPMTAFAGAMPEPHTHVYDQKVVDDKYIKSYATCTSPAVYYMSCACGSNDNFDQDKSGTFTYGDLDSHGAWQFSKQDNVLTVRCGRDNCNASASLILRGKDKPYDGTPVTVTFSGASEWKALVGTSVKLPTIKYYDSQTELAAAPADPGSYTAKITAGEAGGNQATAEIAFKITPKSVPVPIPQTSVFIYDDKEHIFMTLPDGCGLTDDSAKLAATNAGTYTVILQLKDKKTSCWNDGTTDDKTYSFTIMAAPLVIRANNINAVVGDEAPDLSNPVKGTHYDIIGGSTAVEKDLENDRLSISLSLDLTVGTDIDSGKKLLTAKSYDIVPKLSGGIAAGNYSVTSVNGTLTVSDPKTVPVPAGTTYTYTGDPQELMTLPEGTVYDPNGTTAKFDSSTGAFMGTDADTYDVVLNLEDGFQWSDGTTGSQTVTFTINPAYIIIAVNDKTATVGGTAPELSDSDYNLLRHPVPNDFGKVTVALSYKDLDMRMAGSYGIQAELNGTRAGNYETVVAPGTLTVEPAGDPQGVPIPVPEKTGFVYDGTEHTFMTVAGDAAYTAASGSVLSAADAGDYTVTLQLKDKANTCWSDGTTVDKTYTFTIFKTDLIVLVKNRNAKTGSAAPDLSKAAEGTDYTFLPAPAKGDDITVALSFDEKPDMSKAGSYAIKATVSGNDEKNYDIITVDGTLTVESDSAPEPTPTPTPTSAPTPTPEPTATPGPDPTPTATPDPEPTPDPTPAPEPEDQVLLIKVTKTDKKSFTFKWLGIDNVDKYVLYGSECGTSEKEIKTYRGVNTAKVTKIDGEKIKANNKYNFYIEAFDKDGKLLAKSPEIHTLSNNKYKKQGNVTKVKLNKKTLDINVGKTKQVKITKTVYKGLHTISKSHGAPTTWISADESIATVDQNGKITGVAKGKVKIYAQDIGGQWATVTVTVK